MRDQRPPGGPPRAQQNIAERRSAPRIELLGRVHGHAVSMDVDVTVREISLGGMAIETSFAFPIGAIHEFRLMLGDDSDTQLQGRVVHSRPETQPGQPTIFVTGIKFIDESEATGPAVRDLIEKIK